MICSLVAFDPAATECEDGHFGEFCDGTCHCSSGSCDKTTGHCPSGCAAGWSGDNCQTGRSHCRVTLDHASGNILLVTRKYKQTHIVTDP